MRNVKGTSSVNLYAACFLSVTFGVAKFAHPVPCFTQQAYCDTGKPECDPPIPDSVWPCKTVFPVHNDNVTNTHGKNDSPLLCGRYYKRGIGLWNCGAVTPGPDCD